MRRIRSQSSKNWPRSSMFGWRIPGCLSQSYRVYRKCRFPLDIPTLSQKVVLGQRKMLGAWNVSRVSRGQATVSFIGPSWARASASGREAAYRSERSGRGGHGGRGHVGRGNAVRIPTQVFSLSSKKGFALKNKKKHTQREGAFVRFWEASPWRSSRPLKTTGLWREVQWHSQSSGFGHCPQEKLCSLGLLEQVRRFWFLDCDSGALWKGQQTGRPSLAPWSCWILNPLQVDKASPQRDAPRRFVSSIFICSGLTFMSLGCMPGWHGARIRGSHPNLMYHGANKMITGLKENVSCGFKKCALRMASERVTYEVNKCSSILEGHGEVFSDKNQEALFFFTHIHRGHSKQVWVCTFIWSCRTSPRTVHWGTGANSDPGPDPRTLRDGRVKPEGFQP